jgi:hypothetical protein
MFQAFKHHFWTLKYFEDAWFWKHVCIHRSLEPPSPLLEVEKYQRE